MGQADSGTQKASEPRPENWEVLFFGMGCFWGAERIFSRIKGVQETTVGYMGGALRNPSYEQVCTSLTDHAETVQVVYDPASVSTELLLAAFWENHDPTTPNRQGGDVGTQYRSAIFTTTEAQLADAVASRDRYQSRLSERGFGTISTDIKPAGEAGDGVFYKAEEYHQDYLKKNPGGYCNHGFCQVAYSV